MNKSNLDYIDSMRGIAILMVLAVHFTILFSVYGIEHLPLNIENILRAGKFGVALFFIVSAYTLFRSLDIRHENGYKNYFIRRFFRIAPLYYLIIIFLFLTSDGLKYYLEESESGISFFNLLTHMLFINGFFTNYFNSIIGVEWTIFVEVSFYISLPLLFIFRKRIFQITIFFLFVVCITFLVSKLFSLSILEKNQLYFSPLVWYVVFAYGGIIYQYQDNYTLKKIFTHYKNLILICILISLLIFSYIHVIASALIFSFLLGLFFLLNLYNNFTLFNNKVLQKIGELSFSIYLIHMPIIIYIETTQKSENISLFDNSLYNYILLCFIVFLIIILLSLVLYKYIEQPFIKIGKKLITNLKEKS